MRYKKRSRSRFVSVQSRRRPKRRKSGSKGIVGTIIGLGKALKIVPPKA